jgi:hypothetical protein
MAPACVTAVAPKGITRDPLATKLSTLPPFLHSARQPRRSGHETGIRQNSQINQKPIILSPLNLEPTQSS